MYFFLLHFCSLADPVLREHSIDLRRAAANGNLKWLGYISSTGVYGDRDGSWVAEKDPIYPLNEKTRKRAVAEQTWRTLLNRSNNKLYA